MSCQCDGGASACEPGQLIPGVCPAHTVKVSWDDWIVIHVLWPLGVQVLVTWTLKVVWRRLYLNLFERKYSDFRQFLQKYIGTPDNKEVPHGGFMVAICLTHAASSLVILVTWVVNVYQRCMSSHASYILFAGALIDVAHYIVHRIKDGCRAHTAWKLHALVDALTIVPTFYIFSRLGAALCRTSWLSLHFLRAYSLLFNFSQIRATGQLEDTGVFLQMIVHASLRIFCLILIMAGTIFTLEVLGDPAILADNFVQTGAGDSISLAQMVYWIVISITTVGYGDFAPRTLMSRMVTSVFIVIGVAYVFWVQFQFQEAYLRNREGSGAYRPKHKGEQHVVVVLSFRGRANQFASMVAGFLDEIHHSAHGNWPNVVFLSPRPWDQDGQGQGGQLGKRGFGPSGHSFYDFLCERGFPKAVRNRVWFVVGEISSKKDLNRALVGSSALTFLIPDANTLTPDKDDETNIFTALVIRGIFPDARLRLMLLRPQSKELALQAGIEMSRCFSLREMKAHLLAQNVRCHGLLPMITGMLKSADAQDEEAAMRSAGLRTSCASSPPEQDAKTPRRRSRSRESGKLSSESFPGAPAPKEEAPWMLQYVQGLQRSLYGFELGDEYDGVTFGELVIRVFVSTGALVIGILDQGGIKLCPQDRNEGRGIPARTICFAVTTGVDKLESCRAQDEDPDHWQTSLLQIRERYRKRTAREGPHVAAGMLLSSQLRNSLVARESGQPAPLGSDGERMSDVTSDLPSIPKRHPAARGLRLSSGASRLMVPTLSNESKCGGHAGDGTDPSDVERIEALRANLQEGEELVVLVVCHGEVWQQVRTFVGALRARYMPVSRPMVIMTPTKMPPRLLNDCGDRVLCMQGSCTKVQQMMEAGILEAGAIVVMTGELPESQEFSEAPIFKDSRVSLCAHVIECWCGISEHEVFTTYELQDSASVIHLPKLMVKPCVRVDELLSQAGLADLRDEETPDSERESAIDGLPFMTKVNSRTADLFHIGGAEGHRSSENMSMLFHPRFAAGQVFTPELWGAMLGRMFYMPAIIELIEALVMPHRRGQHAFPWQIRVPPLFVGKPFGELVSAMALGWWADVNEETTAWASISERPHDDAPRVSRRETLYSTASSNRISQYSGSFHIPPRKSGSTCSDGRKSTEGPIVVLALHRKRAELGGGGSGSSDHISIPAQGTGGFNYIVLAPAPGTPLRHDDWVLVLGSKRFGRRAQAMGLLRGSRQGSAAAGGPGAPAYREAREDSKDSGGLDRQVSVGTLSEDAQEVTGDLWNQTQRTHV